MAYDSTDIIIDLDLELKKYKQGLVDAEIATKKSVENIADMRAKAEYDNIKVADKLNQKKLALAKAAEKQAIKDRVALEREAQKVVDEYSKAWYAAHKEETKRVEKLAKKKKDSLNKVIALHRKETREYSKFWYAAHKENARYEDKLRADKVRKEKEAAAKVSKTWRGAAPSWLGGDDSGTSFGHKAVTTAQYAAAGAALYGVAEAFRNVAEASIQYDNALFNTMAVLQATKVESEALLSSNRRMAIEYGMSIQEIDNASIVLGRAGVAMSELAEATKVTAQLSKITGDSMEDASKVVSSFTMAFNLASSEVQELGNQLAYAANASKLSIEDLGTMANYALSGAKALGLTKEEVLALSTAFSNVGVNASTIGTQIRKFGKLVRDDAKSSVKFFQELGVNQQQLLSDLKAEDGGEAFLSIVRNIKDMNNAQYEEATAGMEILTKQFLDTLRVTGDRVLDHYDNIEKGGDNLVLQSKIQAQSIEGLWNSATASIGNAASGLATSFVNFFTNRDELIALNETLNGLEKGTLAYSVAMEKVNQLTGGSTGTAVYKKDIAELGHNYVYLSDQMDRYRNKLTHAVESQGALSKEAQYWAAAMGETGRELSTILDNINKLAETEDDTFAFKFLPEPAHLLKVEELINKIIGVEQSAFGVRENSLKLLNIEADKIEDIKSSKEKGLAIQGIVEKSLAIELQYQKDLTAEKKKANAEAEKAAKQREKDLNQRAENQWNNDYDSWFDDDKSDKLREAELAHIAKMKELRAEYNTIVYDGQISEHEHYEESMSYISSLTNSIDGMSYGMKNFVSSVADISSELSNSVKVQKQFSREKSAIDSKYDKDISKIRAKAAKEMAKDYTNSLKIKEAADKEVSELEANRLEEKANNTAEQQRAEIDGYIAIAGAITGALGTAVKEGSEAAKALAVIDSIGAIIKAWNSAPMPYNIPAIAATTAATASLLGQMGANAPSSSTPSPALASSSTSSMTGTVLGDSGAYSESMANSLSLIEEFTEPQYDNARNMAESLESIDNKMGGLASLIVQAGGLALGDTDYSTVSTSTYDNVLGETNGIYDSINGVFGESGYMREWADSLSDITKVFGGGKLSEKLYGSITGSSEVTDYGIKADDQTFSSVLEGFQGQSYTNIKKSNLVSSSTKTQTGELSNEIENQFTSIFESMYKTISEAGGNLGFNVEDALNSFNIEFDPVSFKDKTGEEIQEELTNLFNSIGDRAALAATDSNFDGISELAKYQDIGEGLLETMIRVSTSLEVVTTDLDMINQSISGDTTAISQSLIDLSGGLGEFNDSISSYYENYFTEGEKLAYTTDVLKDRFNELGIVMPTTNDGFRDIVEGLDLSTDRGQETYITLMNLSDSFYDVGSAAEEAAEATADLVDRLARTGASAQQTFNMDLIAELNEAKSIEDQAIIKQIYQKQAAIAAEEERTAALSNSLNIQKDSLSDYLSDVESQISELESIFESLGSVIDKLRGDALGSEYSLNQFYESMTAALNGGDIQDAIDKSSALFNDDAFNSQRDKDFAQLVAANQFEGLEASTLTQIDYLKQIEINTRSTVEALGAQISNLSSSISDSFSYTEPKVVNQSEIDTAVARNTELAKGIAVMEQMNADIVANSNTFSGALFPSDQAIYNANEGMIQALRDSIVDVPLPKYSSYAVGSTNISKDMPANVHQGEIIVPKTFSDGLRSGDLTMGETGDMVSAVKEQNEILYGIISELKNQTLIQDDTKDIQNGSLIKLTEIEQAS